MAKLLTEKYEIEKTCGASVNSRTVKIIVEISSDDDVTIRNDKDQPQFVFTRSDKNTVLAMGMALQEAAELVDARKTKAA